MSSPSPSVGIVINSPESQSQFAFTEAGGEAFPIQPIRTSDWVRDFREQAIDLSWVRGMIAMAREFRTAEQLSDMIVSALAVRDVAVQVRKDHAYGWQPVVVTSPGDLIGYQRRVEEIANRLRLQFSLRE